MAKRSRSALSYRGIALVLVIAALPAMGDESTVPTPEAPPQVSLDKLCKEDFRDRRFVKSDSIEKMCSEIQQLEGCQSVEGKTIFHYDKLGSNPQGKKILVFGQIHGDEIDSGELALLWAERLLKISPKNSWRIVPVLNPDGTKLNTRGNKNGIDLNRNFPTKDWNELAHSEWEKKTGKNPRRFPGNTGGSEPEVACTIKHVETFEPDVVISIHTPYGVLDYDGPKTKKIRFSQLPWKQLGTFPGSMGRYLWTERGIPLLTIELKPNGLQKSVAAFQQLQDEMSYLTLK